MGHSVVLCNRRRPVDFRYAPLATDGTWRCNMSRRATSRHSALIFSADNGYPPLLRVNLSVEFPD